MLEIANILVELLAPALAWFFSFKAESSKSKADEAVRKANMEFKRHHLAIDNTLRYSKIDARLESALSGQSLVNPSFDKFVSMDEIRNWAILVKETIGAVRSEPAFEIVNALEAHCDHIDSSLELLPKPPFQEEDFAIGGQKIAEAQKTIDLIVQKLQKIRREFHKLQQEETYRSSD